MNELITWIADWRHAFWTAVLIVFGPSVLIRIVIRAWPKGDKRRRELLAELAAIPVPKRLMWVLGLFELAWQEGLRHRREQSILWSSVNRLPGAVVFGVVVVDVIGIAVSADAPISQVGFAISTLTALPWTVQRVRAINAFAEMTAHLATVMTGVTRNLEADGYRVADAWKAVTARVAIHARKPRWHYVLGRIPLDAVPNVRELVEVVFDDVRSQLAKRHSEEKRNVWESYQRNIWQIWRQSSAELIENLERVGADEVAVAAGVGELRAIWFTAAAGRLAR